MVKRHENAASAHIAIFVTAFAIATVLVVPTIASERPPDPFGNHTAELNSDAQIVKLWDSLRNKMVIEKGYFRKCSQSGDCPSIPELVQALDGIRKYQGKPLLGHLNLSVNLMMKPAPANWTTPLEAIAMRHGDCKSYSITKYAGAQELGIPADNVRLVIVHIPRRGEDHMVTAVYQEGGWFILDNLTNVLARDSERTDFEPLAVLDYKGVRRYLSAFWMD